MFLSFKLNGSAEEALRQIDEKGYLIPYTLDGRRLVKVGVNFSKEKRNVDRYIVEDCVFLKLEIWLPLKIRNTVLILALPPSTTAWQSSGCWNCEETGLVCKS